MKPIAMTDVQHKLAEQAVAGESGLALIDLITDHFVCGGEAKSEDALERSGAARVLLFMRDLRNGTGTFIKTELQIEK